MVILNKLVVDVVVVNCCWLLSRGTQYGMTEALLYVPQIYNFFSQCVEVGFRTASIDYAGHILIVSVPLYFVSFEDVSNGR